MPHDNYADKKQSEPWQIETNLHMIGIKMKLTKKEQEKRGKKGK